MSPISRQLAWQRAHIEQGLCKNCGEPAVEGQRLCLRHREERLAYGLKRYRNKHRVTRVMHCSACGCEGHTRRACG